jgi:isoleucyl-tRNA synthetase
MAAARSGDWHANADGSVEVAGHTLAEGEFELALHAREGEAAVPVRTNDAVVHLDVEISPELRAEGLARDVIRVVQAARKEQGLNVSDRIRLTAALPDEVADAVRAHRDQVMRAVLATDLVVIDAGSTTERTARVEGHDVSFTIEVV